MNNGQYRSGRVCEYSLRSAMSGSVEDTLIPSSPLPSQESMESSGSTFQILSRESVDLDSNDSATAANNASPDQILLTPVRESSDEDTREGDIQTPDSATQPPIAKPRTLLMRTIASDSSMTPTLTGLPSSPLTHVASSGSMERQPGGTPPTPRPRPRSGEQQEMRQRVNTLETKVSERGRQLEEARKRIAELESENTELETGHRELKKADTETLRRNGLKLQETVRAQETELRNKEAMLKRRESRIAGLEEEVNILRQPYDPKKRLEVRLSEAIGKRIELEKENTFLRENKEGCEREREMRERLEEEKREIEREREEERERFRQQIHQLQTEKARLAEEKSQIEREELQQATKAREELGREVEGLRGRVWEMETQLEEERERARVAEEARERTHDELQDQLRRGREEADSARHQLAALHQEQCGFLQRECTEAKEGCTNLERQLAAANAAREAAEHALKNEQSLTGRLKEEVAKGERTCEEYTIEINSLLRDLDDHTASIGILTEERDRLRTQVEGLRRSFAEKQEQLKGLGEELARIQEREKRLQSQRDGLQSREEIMDLQLKQYQLDFEEERKAREEMVNVMCHLEARDKDSKTQIADLQKQINSLSTEKNYLAFQVEQLHSQMQQPQQQQ